MDGPLDEFHLAAWRAFINAHAAVIDRIEERLAALPTMHPTKQKLLHRTNYYGQVVEMDAQGRLLIPSVLRESAEMKGDVAVLGFLKHLEVWNEQRLLAEMQSAPLSDDDQRTLADLGV